MNFNILFTDDDEAGIGQSDFKCGEVLVQRDRVEIAVRCKQEGKRLVYFIRDHGDGIDMTIPGKLLGVFQRLHSAKEYSDKGVGLAIIIQRIIQRSLNGLI